MTNDNIARAVAAFERLPALMAEDSDLLRRGRYLTVEFTVEIEDVPFFLSISNGRLTAFERGPSLMRPWAFAVRGSAEAWNRFWESVPEAGWHDLFALIKRGEACVEGDLHPFMANLQYIKDLLAAPRRPFKED